MNNKKVSFTISVLLVLFLLASKYIGYPYVLREKQVSTVVQVGLETQSIATTTINISTTTTVHPVKVIKVENFYVVSRVIDGDTIEVMKSGTKEKVRLIGINAPETVDPRRKVECFGREASAYAKEILLGQKVRLMSDDSQTKYDKYGRLLAYMYREDGLFVNKHMIEEGYAYEYTYKVPYLFQKEFKEAQRTAEVEGKGFWAEGVCEK